MLSSSSSLLSSTLNQEAEFDERPPLRVIRDERSSASRQYDLRHQHQHLHTQVTATTVRETTSTTRGAATRRSVLTESSSDSETNASRRGGKENTERPSRGDDEDEDDDYDNDNERSPTATFHSSSASSQQQRRTRHDTYVDIGRTGSLERDYEGKKLAEHLLFPIEEKALATSLSFLKPKKSGARDGDNAERADANAVVRPSTESSAYRSEKERDVKNNNTGSASEGETETTLPPQQPTHSSAERSEANNRSTTRSLDNKDRRNKLTSDEHSSRGGGGRGINNYYPSTHGEASRSRSNSNSNGNKKNKKVVEASPSSSSREESSDDEKYRSRYAPRSHSRSHSNKSRDHAGRRSASSLPLYHNHQQQSSPPLDQSVFSITSSSSNTTAVAHTNESIQEMSRLHATMEAAAKKMDRYIDSLQITINGKDAELQGLKSRMEQLERNYEYNLDIIRERDDALQSASQIVEQKHRALKACEDKLRRSEERVLEADRQAKDSLNVARQREVVLEAEIRATQRRMEELELKHQHQLHDRDLRLERERAEMREHHEQRTAAEDEARAAIVHRLEKALSDKTALLKQRDGEHEREVNNLRDKHLAAERQITELTESMRAIAKERDTLQERLANSDRELYEQGERHKSVLAAMQKRAEEAESAISRGFHEADAAVRVETSRSAQMSAEIATTKATIASLEQRITVLQNQRQIDATSYATEMERMKTLMKSQLVEAEEQRATATSRCETAITSERTAHTNLREIKRLLDEKLSELTPLKAKLVETERSLAVQTNQVHLLEERLFEHKSASNSAADEWKRERLSFDEKEREFSRKLDRIAREQSSERERYHQQISSLQHDFQTLQRELHVSESAREALQEQLNLIDDSHNGPRKTIDALRLQNRDLNEKVVQLESANETIRKQVQLFTEEMSNDPLIKQSREQTEQIAALTKAHEELTAHITALETELTKKDEEIGRYQVDILTTKVTHESELRSAKAEAKAHTKDLLSLSGDDKRAMAATLKEHELWHKKALQLELVVQKMLQERQAMADEIEKLSKKVKTLTTERNAMSEANTVLRVELEGSLREKAEAAVSARAASVVQNYRELDPNAVSHAQKRFPSSGHTTPYTHPPSANPTSRSGSVTFEAASARASSQPQYSYDQNRRSPATDSAVEAVAREQEERINELERKIQMMRSKVVGESGPATGDRRSVAGSTRGYAGGSTAASRSRSVSSANPVVKGRSGAAIRHYGFE